MHVWVYDRSTGIESPKWILPASSSPDSVPVAGTSRQSGIEQTTAPNDDMEYIFLYRQRLLKKSANKQNRRRKKKKMAVRSTLSHSHTQKHTKALEE